MAFSCLRGLPLNILISLIPFIMLLLALVGTYFHNDQGVLDHFRAYCRDVAPTLGPKVMKTLTDVIQSRHIVGILGCVGLLWIATRVLRSLRIALNIVFGAQKKRAMLRGIAVDLLVIVLVRILLFVSMTLSPAVQLRTLFETIDSMLFRIDRIKCRREPLLPPAFCSPHIISVDAILTCSAATVRHFSAAAARSAPLAR